MLSPKLSNIYNCSINKIEKLLKDLNAYKSPGARFSKLPVITGPVKLFCFPF